MTLPLTTRTKVLVAVTLTGAFAAIIPMSAACSSPSLLDNGGTPAVQGGSDGGSASAQAEAAFRTIESDLVNTCGGSNGVCHVQGVAGAPAWLAEPDHYVSIKAYDNSQSGTRKFIVAKPEDSRLFTKGKHSGPELDMSSPLGQNVVAWINAETAAATAIKSTVVVSSPISVASGSKASFDLSSLAKGMAGSSLVFDVIVSGTLLTLSNMQVTAPAGNGIRLQHPVFLSVVGNQATPDPGDSCANVDEKVKEGTTSVFGPGTLVLTTWSATAKLAVSFDYVGPFTVVDPPDAAPTEGGSVGGCKNVSGFQGIVGNFTGGLSLNCVGCHAGGNAQNSLDMSELSKGSPDYAYACAAMLNSVSLSDKPNSPLILAPAGSLTHQGGKLSTADQGTFKTAVLSWLAGE